MTVAYFCLLLGIQAMGVSGYYSLVWFLDKGMPKPIAWTLAIVYVGFANIVFEKFVEARELSTAWHRKVVATNRKHKLSKVRHAECKLKEFVLFLAWAGLAGYSMFCTIGGQYDQLMVDEAVFAQAPVETFVDYTPVILMKETRLNELQLEVTSISDRLSTVGTIEERWEYNGTTTRSEERIDNLRTAIDELVTEIAGLRSQQLSTEYIDKLGISKRGFYVYLSDLSEGKWAPAKIQFYSALVPSVVVDIISPICISIFIVAWRKKNGKAKNIA